MEKKRLTRIIVTVLLFSCILFSQASGQTEDFYTNGYIAADDKTLYIKDSIAIWKEDGKKLIIELYPFKVTEEEIKLFLENVKGDFRISLSYNKPSPDNSKWQWCPQGAITIKFDEPNKDKILENATSVLYSFYGLTKKNFTMNFAFGDKEIRDVFNTYAITKERNQDVLEMSTKGEHTKVSGDSRTNYSWDLKIRTKIFTSN